MGYVMGSSHNVVLGAVKAVVTGFALWGAVGGGLNIRAGTHLLLGFGVGLLTRHHLRWNVWTVKVSATEGILWADHRFDAVKSAIFTESAELSTSNTHTDCEAAVDVVESAELHVHN